MHAFANKSRLVQQLASARSKTLNRTYIGQRRDIRSFLHTHRRIDNPVKTEPNGAGSTRGLSPEADNGEIIRGRTTGEIIGDIGRPIGTALGNVAASTASMLTGISITTTTNQGPTWNNHGAFVWHVGFNTTGRTGWIIQDVVNTWRAKDARGNAVPSPVTPHFLEAWAVDNTGKVTPSIGTDNDYWDNPNLVATYGAVEGHLATRAKLYFTKTDPAAQGFIKNNPATNAAGLLSSTTTPANLGIVRLYRYAQSTWDSTGAAPIHFGSAGP
ncbi:hypothetical protein [Nitrosomonas marina]|uniref:Uncharacterized protein n=1 Tax=Nitrosomonas marina TaxID=917 RepID=A0A1H8AEP3_9PROT|nr:hypothetical protein [Nitrosomonas marina]SEM68007.1 hypothetical protein SAMN05216325_10164 [Nitrosomonas marina]